MITIELVRSALERVIDPEFGLDIVNLGMIYGVDIHQEAGEVHIFLTLTTRGCPLADHLRSTAAAMVARVSGVRQVRVSLVWEPPWQPEMISPYGRSLLNGQDVGEGGHPL